jgi:hypothetical protein
MNTVCTHYTFQLLVMCFSLNLWFESISWPEESMVTVLIVHYHNYVRQITLSVFLLHDQTIRILWIRMSIWVLNWTSNNSVGKLGTLLISRRRAIQYTIQLVFSQYCYHTFFRPRYSWNIVECGVKRYISYPILFANITLSAEHHYIMNTVCTHYTFQLLVMCFSLNLWFQ